MTTFEVPAAKASLEQNKFKFKIPGEKKMYSLPYAQYLTNGLKDPLVDAVRKIAPLVEAGKQDQISPEEALAIQACYRTIFERYAPGAFDLMDKDQAEALIEAWQEASNTSVGK